MSDTVLLEWGDGHSLVERGPLPSECPDRDPEKVLIYEHRVNGEPAYGAGTRCGLGVDLSDWELGLEKLRLEAKRFTCDHAPKWENGRSMSFVHWAKEQP